MPSDYTLVEALLKDSAFRFVDNVNTSEHETLEQVVTQAFQKAIPTIAAADQDGRLTWSRSKDSGIRHLLRLEPLSRFHLRTGGGENVINATKQFHAPSWRMVVQLTDDIKDLRNLPGRSKWKSGQ